MTPGAKTIDSSSNLRARRRKNVQRAIACFFRFLSSCYSSRDNGRFSWEETVILQNLTFDDLWWPEYWPERKNDRNDFERSRWELSIAFFRVFLALLVFEPISHPSAQVMGWAHTSHPSFHIMHIGANIYRWCTNSMWVPFDLLPCRFNSPFAWACCHQ